MSDVALIWNSAAFAADLSITANDLARDEGLRSAIELSLFTDRRAEDGDVLPTGENDRRGFWADEFNEIEGDKFGSRLWLLARAKREQSVLERAEEYAREALAWLVEDRVASRVDVTAEFIGPTPGLGIVVVVHRPQRDVATFRFGTVWTAEEGS